MKFLEIIQIRSTSGQPDDILPLLKDFCREADCPGLMEMKTYSHLQLKGDLSLHLVWNVPFLQGSPLGLRLSQTLKDFGLINRNGWKEEEE